MLEASILAAIRVRLETVLAPPRAQYRPFNVDERIVGWLDDDRAARLGLFGETFAVHDRSITFAAGLATPGARTAALDRVNAVLAGDGLLTAWRDERYAVGEYFGPEPMFMIERAAARFFGIHTYAVHVNGLVRQDDKNPLAAHMWIARRSPHKAIDPGLLDNLVGGGIASGASVRDTLIRESWEEAGIAATLAGRATPAGTVHICRAQPDGLHRETIFVHDLFLPADFEPCGQDDEVVEHRLVPLAEAASLIAHSAGPRVVTGDASLVIVDCLLRHGIIEPDAPGYLALEALRHPSLQPMSHAER